MAVNFKEVQLKVFARIYGIAVLFYTSAKAQGIQLEEGTGGLLYHIKHAEAVFKNPSHLILAEIMDLYFTLVENLDEAINLVGVHLLGHGHFTPLVFHLPITNEVQAIYLGDWHVILGALLAIVKDQRIRQIFETNIIAAKSQCRASHRFTSQKKEEDPAIRILSHREATYARLCGTFVGEYRSHEGSCTLEEYDDNDLCICSARCFCAKACTLFPTQACPCSSRVVDERLNEMKSVDTFATASRVMAEVTLQSIWALGGWKGVKDMILPTKELLVAFEELMKRFGGI